MDENQLAELVLAHFVQALRLVVGALDIVDLPQDATLHQLQDLETTRQQLEVSTVALLQLRGISWETMADELGVARQSLHRRLARKVMAYRDSTRSGAGLERLRIQLTKLINEEAEGLAKDGALRVRRGARILAREQHRGPSVGPDMPDMPESP